MNITLIGLGKMGVALAGRLLLNSSFQLTVFNRTKEKMQPLIQAGAKGAASLQEAVKNADIVITALLDDDAVIQVVSAMLDAMPKGAIHIGTSTILPETSKRMTALHAEHQQIYVGGNVLGVPKVAEKGGLTTLAAGDETALQKCDAIFKSYSSTVVYVGKEAYQANAFKICTNYLLSSAIEAMGEIYTFAEKSQIDLEVVYQFFHLVFAHPAYKLYIDKIRERKFDEVNFDLKGGMKDITLFQQAFAQVGVVPDIANILKDKFIVALAHGMAGKDWSAVTDITRMEANI